MDKNKCPILNFKNTLTDKKFCLDNEKLSSQFKRYILFLLCYFFLKKLKNIFFVYLNGNFRKHNSAKFSDKI